MRLEPQRPGTMAAAALALALAASPAATQSVRQGGIAPEINLPTLAGGRVQLSKLRGRPVVVSFWNTWCAPCRTEFPELVRVHHEHVSAGLYVLAVNERDQELRAKDVQEFVDEFSVPFAVALDQRGRSRRTYLIFGLPTTVFIDTGGVVHRIHRGPISREQLDRGIAAILPLR
ncbi:MAG TPA: TlpA disulfide reductase family protein [Gemmatimonadaceae bacterium]